MLRMIVARYAQDVIFKGGTSLSKGWALIDRFSEAIDLYVETGDRGAKARRTLLKEVCTTVSVHLELTELKGQSLKGIARSVPFAYPPARPSDAIAPTVLLELGIQSGTFPTEIRAMTSILSDVISQQGLALDQDDCRPFDINVLHFRRTFVEKLFALHDKVERGLLNGGQKIGSYARHYYDLACLIDRDEVRAMLESDEFATIAVDYQQRTQDFFPKQVFPPNLELATSQAFFPLPETRSQLLADYNQQCQILCYSAFPAFEDVLDKFTRIRPWLGPLA